MRKKASLLIAICGLSAIATNHPEVVSPTPEREMAKLEPALSESQVTLLNAHNQERVNKNLPKLAWSAKMQADAQVWANRLASEDRMFHSTYEGREKAGENLWSGSTGRYTPQQMMDAFLNEKQYFRSGKFPNVTTTKNWQDVGHYTQIIWPDTEQVGCAVAKSSNFDYLGGR